MGERGGGHSMGVKDLGGCCCPSLSRLFTFRMFVLNSLFDSQVIEGMEQRKQMLTMWTSTVENLRQRDNDIRHIREVRIH